MTRVFSSRLPYCCGVVDVGNFTDNASYGASYGTLISNIRSGTGIFTATFVNTTACKRAYEKLKQSHTLLYQSPLRRNTNSYREVFLCVFSTKARM